MYVRLIGAFSALAGGLLPEAKEDGVKKSWSVRL